VSKDNRIEDFRHALAATLRAMAHVPEFDLTYTADKPGASGNQARVPQPARGSTAGSDIRRRSARIR